MICLPVCKRIHIIKIVDLEHLAAFVRYMQAEACTVTESSIKPVFSLSFIALCGLPSYEVDVSRSPGLHYTIFLRNDHGIEQEFPVFVGACIV